MNTIFKKHPHALPATLIGLVMIFFWVIYPIYPNTVATRYEQALLWMFHGWAPSGDYMHCWAIPLLFVVFVVRAWPKMSAEVTSPSLWGLLVVGLGLFLYVASARTLQPRLSQIGIPFLIFGGVYYVYGWKVARHMLFPAFFWWFGVHNPSLQHATNILQLAVTKSCYAVGTACGMQLVNAGNEIRSATDSWNSLNIAEGCSGIRSLMALVMISAIYAYLTQKQVWKMAFLFACSLPLALLANFFRIFTIVVLAELGFSEFAAGVYHDWAGLLFFFPIALAGLFTIDKLLNWRNNRKKVRSRMQK